MKIQHVNTTCSEMNSPLVWLSMQSFSTQSAKILFKSKQILGKPQIQKSWFIFTVNGSSHSGTLAAWIHFSLWFDGVSYTYSPETAAVRDSLLADFCIVLKDLKHRRQLPCAFSLKREEEEIAEEAEDNEANDPVDRVYIDDHHVHVKSPAMRIILKVEGIKPVALVRELASPDWTCLPLKA